MKGQYGWNGFFEKAYTSNYNDDFICGRIISLIGNNCKLITKNGELSVENQLNLELSIGDFVVLKEDHKKITNVLPRTSYYRNKEGKCLASNFDTVFIIHSLTNLNIKKVEKSILQVWETGAVPVVVLTKLDLCDDYLKKCAEVKLIAKGVDVFTISTETNEGIPDLEKYLRENKTVLLLGSSGEGMTSLIHKLTEKESLRVNNELYLLPNGSLIIDILEEDQSQNECDLNELVQNCRFHNCTHTLEPGCAVLEAIESGILDQGRVYDFIKKQKQEVEFTLDEIPHFEYKKRPKELYNKGRRKEQW